MNYATGTKGLMQWLQKEQPQMYAKVAPAVIAQQRKMNIAAYGPGLGCVRLKGLGDDSTDLTSISTDFSDFAPPDVDISVAGSDPVAASSTGNTSTAIASTIANIANAFTSATLTQAQIQANNTLLQTNLARAQQGLPPLTANQVVSGSSATPILLLGGALVLLLVMGKKAA